ncbi:Epoxyqueuosine reductase QueG (queuosine biosynthesis) [Methanococcoides vulcani]|uniref:Epoxyqueuosine reductase QueG (Queuosine biosynthesis) n=1 Tax=Methanococcoides vulcani TaxID=1353158 RepID=A0A1H9YJN6_9EURY|nr:4Fe-4S binding protein [Methanococcoides vulcani]SES69161.1 Epoxyqueuosine reductase QueG (queuosine biosynthesis) [Methanococcoides vulcani]
MEQQLKEALLDKCREMEIPVVGVANVERWEKPLFQPWIPEEFYPHSIYPEARSVIVIGLPVTLPVLETSPSIYYRELYKTMNSLLDQYTYRLSSFLTEKGYPSVFVPRDGYGSIKVLLDNPVAFFSHRHAAFLAGLGNFGVNNTILTPEYGPRIRFGTIFTTAELESDNTMEEQLCNHCMRCVRMCPSNALEEKNYPQGITDKKACASFSDELNKRYVSPCGICIKVCPIGEDRRTYRREDASMYENKDDFKEYHNTWEHVRPYGGR